MIIIYILMFLISCGLLYFAGELVVGALVRVARFLGWREFVVAFFVMAFAASLPNFFVGISSALHKIPHLSLGDIAGNNLIAMTVAVAIGALLTKEGLPAQSRTVQTTSLFTMIAAILPFVLILDGILSRPDGLILISFFIFYNVWLFSKKDRFTRIYDGNKEPLMLGFKIFLKDLGKVAFGILLFIIAAEGIVRSAQVFATALQFPLILVGILITSLGNALPEIYFSAISAKRGDTWMILGNLMGSVIVPATLVLGIVALITPIIINDLSYFFLARFFLIISAVSFFFISKTGHKITKKESIFLLALYIIFIIAILIDFSIK